jgi:taurine--2-oxoglutarate transaminase
MNRSFRPEADSVLHSWCVPEQWDAPTVVGGQGAWLHLADGRRILDLSSLSECSLLGHQHPKLVQAIRDQAEALCFVTNQWGARVRAELAEELLEVSGLQGGRVFFTLAGAECQRERRQDRAPGQRPAARGADRTRPLVPRRHVPGHGLVG